MKSWLAQCSSGMWVSFIYLGARYWISSGRHFKLVYQFSRKKQIKLTYPLGENLSSQTLFAL